MIDLKYQCGPCNPFTKDKCFFCLKIKLKAVEHARAIKAHDDLRDDDELDDVLSVFPNLELGEAEEMAA
jgi:hypothetical protein